MRKRLSRLQEDYEMLKMVKFDNQTNCKKTSERGYKKPSNMTKKRRKRYNKGEKY